MEKPKNRKLHLVFLNSYFELIFQYQSISNEKHASGLSLGIG